MQTFSLLSFILESGWPCIHLDWGSKYDFRSHQKLQPHQIDHHIETNDEGEVQRTGIRFDIHKRWHVDWISSTTGCHIRPMQTFSLLWFILESGWLCIQLDWGLKYDFRSQQKQFLIETSDGGEVQTGNDYRGDLLDMCRRSSIKDCDVIHCKNSDRSWKPPGMVERECWYCCVKERCRVNFVSLSNWKKWRSCRPSCKRVCNA